MEERERNNKNIEIENNKQINEEINETSKENNVFCVPKLPIKLNKEVQQTHQQQKCDYNPPEWSATPNDSDIYYLEVIKNGTIVEKINLEKSSYTFGRNNTCDVVLEHPSLSRFHALLQFSDGKFDSNKYSKGFYLYDLNSTHGTFLNKKQINSKEYIHVKNGYCFKFGGSTRLFIMHDEASNCLPNDDDLNINLTHEQMRKIKENYSKIALKLKIRKEIEEEEATEREKQNEQEINWNIDDNNELNSGSDSSQLENIIKTSTALNIDKDESYYLSDPRKILKQYFEREGEELHYDIEELLPGRFKCVIRLPIDNNYGEAMYAQVEYDGKKKECMTQCALEACRILDSVGCLRQSAEELRHEKKKRDWQANDYYDSDEDTYLDRTGDIEKKRQKRMERNSTNSGDNSNSKNVHTFDSLKCDYINLNSELIEINEKLDKCKQLLKAVNDDDIDAYINTLKTNSNVLDTVTRTKLKRRIIEINNELIKLDKLLLIAKPSSFDVNAWKKDVTNDLKLNKTNKDVKLEIDKSIIENKSIEATKTNLLNQLPPDKSLKNEKTIDNLELKQETKVKEETIKKTKVVEENKIKSSNNKSVDNDLKEEKQEKKPKKQIEYKYPSNDPDYNFWLPPEDQFGDGKTKLNEKYGY